VVTWNCRRASAQSALWGYLAELDPDVAMLQEVCGLPAALRDLYDIKFGVPRTKAGKPQAFASALMVKGAIGESVPLSSPEAWVREQLNSFQGNILSYEVNVGGGCPMTAVAAYSPAWPVSKSAYAGVDVTGVKLSQNPDLWVTDILTAALRHGKVDCENAAVVAGDFNACETFDSWKGGPRGNREWLDRMADIGFMECLRHHQGQLTPTFRGPGRKVPNCQIDHLFVNQVLASRLIQCTVGDAERVFGQSLSDHLPVIADFARQ
jgi:endonuclease/exonuclease/phosphatase family metal-dependent hydrolase